MEDLDARKGAKLRFIRGVYKDMPGWYDKAGATFPKMVSVIVKQNSALKQARVKKTSILKVPTGEARSPAEAILHHHTDIQSKITDLCKFMAACHVQVDHTLEFSRYFQLELHNTLVEHQADPKSKYFAKPEFSKKTQAEEDAKMD